MSSKVWYTGVRVFILNEKKELLMVQHTFKDETPFWVLPGGSIEDGEFIADAVVREVMEETGLKVQPGRLLFTVEEKSPEGVLGYTFYVMAELEGGSMVLGYDPELPDDAQILSGVNFFSRQQLMGMSKAYPEIVQGRFWQMLDSGRFDHDPHAIFPSKGFGQR